MNAKAGTERFANNIGDQFTPMAFASWFQARLEDWAVQTGYAPATAHAFRKTALQHARRGEDLNRQVAGDARLSESVMMAHYVSEHDEEYRQASNRTYQRLVLSLSFEVASRFGYQPDDQQADLERRLAAATAAKDWPAVEKPATELRRRSASEGGNASQLSFPVAQPSVVDGSRITPIVSENF